MGAILSFIHYVNQTFLPAWYRWNIEGLGPISSILATIGLIPLIVHRMILERENLLKTPPHQDPKKRQPPPAGGCPYRPDDGYGTDVKNPTASMEGAPIGRNMPAIPKHERNPRGGPDVQLVAQRLLARESFKPAGPQLNIIAAAWIQTMVHDWIKHEDGAPTTLENSIEGCPLHKSDFFETKERPDGHFNSERTQWWDASFVYGNNTEQVKYSRSGVGGKLKVDESNPDVLPSRPDGTDLTGDNSNSWAGVAILQIIFLKEHNYCADQIAKENPGLSDDEIYGYCRNIISALVAKIHTTDWTCELLKTKQLKIGMETNWKGIFRAVLGKDWDFLPSTLRLIEKDGADNKGVPFCLTEEFTAVYRLHPLLPPGLIIEHEGSKPDEFIDLVDLLTASGRKKMREPGMSKKMMKSCFSYPCGALVGANYADSMRDLAPTDKMGVDIPNKKIDLAAIDLYRDRERGIQNYNDFRRHLKLKPFKTWEGMTGNKDDAQKLEAIYGAAPAGIEKCDLLVGDLYEKKIPGFAISETSFMIFLLMASRRLDADPYLNEYYDEKHYTPFGMAHIKGVAGLMDLLKRHYPDLASAFPQKDHSAFKPIYGNEKWKANEHLYERLTTYWAKTKETNDAFFKKLLAKE